MSEQAKEWRLEGEREERMREKRGGEENTCREIKPDSQGLKGQDQRDEEMGGGRGHGPDRERRERLPAGHTRGKRGRGPEGAVREAGLQGAGSGAGGLGCAGLCG